jgi:hypothetical protein
MRRRPGLFPCREPLDIHVRELFSGAGSSRASVVIRKEGSDRVNIAQPYRPALLHGMDRNSAISISA